MVMRHKIFSKHFKSKQIFHNKQNLWKIRPKHPQTLLFQTFVQKNFPYFKFKTVNQNF